MNLANARLPFALALVALLAACGSMAPGAAPVALPLGADPAAACVSLGALVPAAAIGLPSGQAVIDSAVWTPARALAVAERGATPAARVTPALPAFCKLLGQIAPLDPAAPPVRFQVNLPAQWNGRTVQYGGGGFNGVLIDALALVPAQRFDTPPPLALGYVTYGTDSGHQNKPGEPPQTFALNDEALLNFAHASYKKVRDVAVALVQRAYGQRPARLYFVGSSEGGREGMVMAQRYPADFDGIFSRVPVLNWTGLQHAGLRDGRATMAEGWIRPAQTQRVHQAVLAACDAADGLADGIIADPVACRQLFDPAQLRCKSVPDDACLTEPQILAIKTLGSPFRFDFDLAHGVREYPGRGPSGEGLPAFGPTGGWQAWWLGSSAPSLPPVQANSIAWFYGAGAIQYFYAQDPKADLMRYQPARHRARIEQVSALMDATDPDLSAFQARGGKLLLLENLADYAQSPYAGIQYHKSVVQRMGQAKVDGFFKLYTAPGVDHVGSGAPSQLDMLAALTAWVEQGRAPQGLQLVQQTVAAPFAVERARPLCEWPLVPRYQGGDADLAASFLCRR